MSDYAECALPKTEEGWLSGIQMKDDKKSSQKQELERFKRLLKEISEPNCGRIAELKEKIKNNTLVTKEAVEEAAERLAARFLGKS